MAKMVDEVIHNVNEAGTQAVERAARMLGCLIECERALSIGELCAATGIKQPTVSRIVGALERNGILARDGRRGLVKPGPLLLRLAASDFAYHHLIDIADPYLRKIAGMTHETVNLCVPARSGVNHLTQIDSDQLVGTTNWVGREGTFPLLFCGQAVRGVRLREASRRPSQEIDEAHDRRSQGVRPGTQADT